MFESARPENSPGRKTGVRWVYQKIERGTSRFGWLAGEPTGVWTHFQGTTKPCRERLTKGKLSCPFCDTKHIPVWRGYVPYYDQEYTRRFVLISEDYFESVLEIEHLAMVKLTRGKGTREPVIITENVWRSTPIPPLRERADPVNLMAYLPTIWKDDEIIKLAAKLPPSLPVPVEKSAVTKPPKSQQKKAESLANRVGDLLHVRDGEDLRPVGEMFPGLAAKAAGNNGKPHD